DLGGADEASLREAFEVSRHFSLPQRGAPAAAYHLCAQFSELLPTLSPADARALSAMLEVFRRSDRGATCTGHTLKRVEETPM
ncbi:XRE family transcriptional regulator, partial [Corallococcus sp. AB049A]